MNAGRLLSYEYHVPSQEEIASHLQIRLNPQDVVLGDMITQTQYIASTTPASIKPSDSSLKTTLTHLEQIVNRPKGNFWKDVVQAIGPYSAYPRPAKAIHADDLVNLISEKGILPAVARWAIFQAIENGTLMAVCQTAIFEPIPELTREQRIQKRQASIRRWQESLNVQKEVTSSPIDAETIAPTAPRYTQGLLVWSKSQKNPSKRGARSKSSMSTEDEQRIAEAWNTGSHKTYADLANERGGGETGQDIKRVLDRVNKRRQRSTKRSIDK